MSETSDGHAAYFVRGDDPADDPADEQTAGMETPPQLHAVKKSGRTLFDVLSRERTIGEADLEVWRRQYDTQKLPHMDGQYADVSAVIIRQGNTTVSLNMIACGSQYVQPGLWHYLDALAWFGLLYKGDEAGWRRDPETERQLREAERRTKGGVVVPTRAGALPFAASNGSNGN